MPETVTPEDILKEGGATKPVVPHTFLQRVGVQLAAGVGGVLAVVILSLVSYWILTVPKISTPSQALDPDKLRQAFEMQRQLQELHTAQVTQMFDKIVLQCLFPLFTTVLGYIFGSQAEKRARD